MSNGLKPVTVKVVETTFIYALCEPDTGEIRYFGKTSQPIKNRLSRHLRCADVTHNACWIKGLKIQGKLPVCQVLMSGLTQSEASEEEIALIAWGRRKGLRLTNLTEGGEGSVGYCPTEEARQKIREARKRQVSPWKGRHPTEETRAKMSAAKKGKRPAPALDRRAKFQVTSEAKFQEILRLLYQGKTKEEIAIVFGIAPRAVCKFLREWGTSINLFQKRIVTQETRKIMSQVRTGRTLSPEARKKVGAASRLRHERERQEKILAEMWR